MLGNIMSFDIEVYDCLVFYLDIISILLFLNDKQVNNYQSFASFAFAGTRSGYN